jgi:asparagine synthase (glutamine-hydrolysing)
MCGFCLAVNDAEVDIHGLTESIRHRGPDSTKYFLGTHVLCGFNRLAIVDDDPRSDQPMLDSSGRYLLVFNGEIYNYNDLRKRLADKYGAQFVTRSDTEVLLKGLINEGRGFLSRLDGIFALAFVDLASREVMLARDVFGVKPLYYCLRGDRLYVSSEIRPLWQMTGSTLRFSNIARYLAYGVVANGESIIAGVEELEPNTVRVLHVGNVLATAKIQDFDYGVRDHAPIDEIGQVLQRTIEEQKPEIRYGVLFSGGLDSTLVLERCVEDDRLRGAYSVDVCHPDMSERRWQEYVITSLSLEQKYRRIELRKEDLSVDNIIKLSEGLDLPLFHPNFIGSFLLTRLASDDGLKVLLSGEGADELFLGYRWFFSEQPVSEFLEYVPLLDVEALLQGGGAVPVSTSGMSLLEIFQRVYLQRWLARQDLTGMANSVEVRVPFLGLEVARLLNALSVPFKKGDGDSKWIIKRLLGQRFSEAFVKRKKVGFDFPLNDWIGDRHIAFLRDASDLIDSAVLDLVIKKYERSYLRNRIVFSLVAFCAWYQSARAAAVPAEPRQTLSRRLAT